MVGGLPREELQRRSGAPLRFAQGMEWM